MKISTYDHRGTSEMEKLANKFAYSDEEKDLEEVEEMEITSLTKVEETGKIPIEQDSAQGSTEKQKVKGLN